MIQDATSRVALAIFFATTITKLIMIPLYHSTDFEVHRNWMALTHSLPISQWYYESTSQWTLDYPPFFAYFEWLLSQLAALVDPNMVDVHRLEYCSAGTLVFQRLTVIAGDILLYLAITQFFCTWPTDGYLESKGTAGKRLAVLVISVTNPGLLFVDHIHFQYNGILLAFFLQSITFVRQGRDVLAALCFAILLNFKHIFLYVSPVYFVYLLRHYCFDDESVHFVGWQEMDKKTKAVRDKFRISGFVVLGAAVGLVFALSLGPFILMGQAQQLIARLFPFQRGLSHAYWAPNVWALYNAFDRFLAQVQTKLLRLPSAISSATTTTGLVGQAGLAVLPSIPPWLTAALTALTMMPALASLWRHPHPRAFLPAVVYCSLCSFMLGWHVHEKAILISIVPLSLAATDSRLSSTLFYVLAFIGHFTLFPLLYEPQETPVKVLLFVFHSIISYALVNQEIKARMKANRTRLGTVPVFVIAFLSLMLPLFLLTVTLPLLFPRLEFLPLMLTSVYGAVGNVYGWILAYKQLQRRISEIEALD